MKEKSVVFYSKLHSVFNVEVDVFSWSSVLHLRNGPCWRWPTSLFCIYRRWCGQWFRIRCSIHPNDEKHHRFEKPRSYWDSVPTRFRDCWLQRHILERWINLIITIINNLISEKLIQYLVQIKQTPRFHVSSPTITVELVFNQREIKLESARVTSCKNFYCWYPHQWTRTEAWTCSCGHQQPNIHISKLFALWLEINC